MIIFGEFGEDLNLVFNFLVLVGVFGFYFIVLGLFFVGIFDGGCIVIGIFGRDV